MKGIWACVILSGGGVEVWPAPWRWAEHARGPPESAPPPALCYAFFHTPPAPAMTTGLGHGVPPSWKSVSLMFRLFVCLAL